MTRLLITAFFAPLLSAGFHAQVFAYVKRSKNMSENLIFARNKVFEQFFEAKYMSKKMSNLKGPSRLFRDSPFKCHSEL